MATPVGPFSFLKEYTSFGADIDLLTEAPSLPLQPRPMFARYIRVVAGSGTVALEMTGGNVTLTMAAGDFEVGEIRKILTAGTSGPTRIRIGW